MGAPCCGAKTRAGGTCKQPGTLRGGRCHFHGGKSTGPRTPEGKARTYAAVSAAQKAKWAAYREAKARAERERLEADRAEADARELAIVKLFEPFKALMQVDLEDAIAERTAAATSPMPPAVARARERRPPFATCGYEHMKRRRG